jgi:RNA polymerase sigma-70 factor (ECF subfamily)
MRSLPAEAAPGGALSDEEVVRRVLGGEVELFEIVMRRNNQRLFRTIRALVPNDTEAEEILQESYVRAYQHLVQFAGRARFATWLTRIAIHEVLARQRRVRRLSSLDTVELPADVWQDTERTPEENLRTAELEQLVARAIEAMPESLRVVFVLREVEGLATDETAECLGLSAANVKVRLHRARSLLRSRIDRRLVADLRNVHKFAGDRCDHIVASVLRRLG